MSASGPGDRVASTRDIAIYFREDCRPLRDSLQLEMVVAQYCVQIRDVRSTSGVPVGDSVGAGVIAELEGHGDPLSNAILRGIADIGAGDVAKRAADAAARLAERTVGVPTEFADVGKARALGAWRTSEGAFEGEFVLFAEYEHPRGRRHSVALFVEPRRGGTVKHMGLIGPMDELGGTDPFHPSAMETVDLRDAGALIRQLLERSYGPSAAHTDDFRALMALARARAMIA